MSPPNRSNGQRPVLQGRLAKIAKPVKTAAQRSEPLSKRCLAIQGDNRLILPHFPANSVHCTISSPPYGDQKNYGSPDEIGSGNKDYLGYLEDLRRIVGELYRITVDGGVMWLVLDTLKRDGQSIPLPFQAINIAEQHKWVFQECVIWDKGKSLPWSHTAHFRGVFEYVLLFVKGRVRHFDLDAVRDADHLSSYWVKYPERFNPLGKSPTDLWHIPIPVQGSWSSTDLRHLCPFPEELVRRMIALTSKAGDVVLDPFAGTGTVPAVANAMKRLGVGIELNKRYYEAFIKKGFEQISRSATNGKGPKSADLADLIRDLRVLKYPRTLFTQVSRADRLGDDARTMIDAMLVNRETLKAEETPRIRVTLLASATKHVRAIQKAVSAASIIPPLSKFGLEAVIEVVDPKLWKSSAYRPIQAADSWFKYKTGTFNTFHAKLNAEEMKAVMRGTARGKEKREEKTPENKTREKKTRVPPIYSKLRVNVKAGIVD